MQSFTESENQMGDKFSAFRFSSIFQDGNPNTLFIFQSGLFILHTNSKDQSTAAKKETIRWFHFEEKRIEVLRISFEEYVWLRSWKEQSELKQSLQRMNSINLLVIFWDLDLEVLVFPFLQAISYASLF